MLLLYFPHTKYNLNTQVHYNVLILQTELYCMQSLSAVQYVNYNLKLTCFVVLL
jgi:hypothetical protein